MSHMLILSLSSAWLSTTVLVVIIIVKEHMHEIINKRRLVIHKYPPLSIAKYPFK